VTRGTGEPSWSRWLRPLARILTFANSGKRCAMPMTHRTMS